MISGLDILRMVSPVLLACVEIGQKEARSYHFVFHTTSSSLRNYFFHTLGEGFAAEPYTRSNTSCLV